MNSFHHQAVSLVGSQFSVCAKSGDGVIEAIEHHTLPFALGVQWHPECMYDTDQDQRKIFDALVQYAAGG